MHFGIVSPPVSGHIHPFAALGRELIGRGHRVSFLQMADLAERVQNEGLGFITIGESDHPRGSLPESLAQLGRLQGLAALRFTISAIRKTTEMICRDAPAAVRRTGIDALLVDQTEPAGGSVAELLGIPFVTICNAMLMNSEPLIPPPFTGWRYRSGIWGRLRNSTGYAVHRRIMRPVTEILDRYRAQWKLPTLRDPEDSFSKLAQISQQPAAFEFPRTRLPETFHYVGPLRNDSGPATPFPWHKLDGRPLIYASLGTLQNRKENMFRTFAEACAGLDAQLVITHGHGLAPEIAASFPGDPLIVGYAPQRAVLAKARLTLTHAGLNTTLDSLAAGVPLVAIPITYEQPAIASRIAWTGTGRVVRLAGLAPDRLRTVIREALADEECRRKALRMREAIASSGGVERAASLVGQVVCAAKC